MIGGDEPVALAAYWKSSATALSHAAFLMQVSAHEAARFCVVLLKLE
jgi:DICT domain-containing protein